MSRLDVGRVVSPRLGVVVLAIHTQVLTAENAMHIQSVGRFPFQWTKIKDLDGTGSKKYGFQKILAALPLLDRLWIHDKNEKGLTYLHRKQLAKGCKRMQKVHFAHISNPEALPKLC